MSYCASTRKQVYLCPLLCRNTDSYEDERGSFELCFCVCKIKQKNWIWQGFGPKKSFCCSLLQLLQLVLQREGGGWSEQKKEKILQRIKKLVPLRPHTKARIIPYKSNRFPTEKAKSFFIPADRNTERTGSNRCERRKPH
jgi:hypothetical protein